MKRFIYLLIALFLIIFEAVPEGLALGGHKTIAGIMEAVYRAGITLTVFAYITVTYPNKPYTRRYLTFDLNYWYIVIGYVLLRFALFDIIHNISAGIPVFFIGSTKLFDIVMSKLATWGWFLRIIAFVWGVAWLMQWWGGIRKKNYTII